MDLKQNTTVIAIAFVGLLLVAILFSRLAFKVKGPENQTSFEKEFGMVMTDYQGNTVHLYDFRRKVLVTYVWASWCTYCAQELENLGQLKQKYGDDIQILAINRGEPLPTAKEFTDKLKTVQDILFLLDPSDSFFKAIAGYAMPETVFINGKGDIAFHQRGPLKLEEASAQMEELVK